MKKWLGSFIALALFLVPINAIAAVKAGDSCKKVGVTATANGKKFTCVKSGKKLVWNKGVAVVKPTPTPTKFIYKLFNSIISLKNKSNLSFKRFCFTTSQL